MSIDLLVIDSQYFNILSTHSYGYEFQKVFRLAKQALTTKLTLVLISLLMLTPSRYIRLRYFVRINIFLLIVCVSICCKDDKLSNQSNASAEEIYFDDFKSNPFKWGYINMKGNITIKALYEDNRNFSEGLAAANYKGKWGYINKRGETVIDFQFRTTTQFSEGLAIVQLFDREYITIDKVGHVIATGDYEEQYPYQNDRSRIKKDGQYGYVNTDGIRIDTTLYLKASNFNNGKAVVLTRDGYHIIDKDLQPLTHAVFDKIYNSETRYWKYKNGKYYGYLDSENEFKVWQSNLSKAGQFEDGIACIKDKNTNYIIDETGRKKEIPYSSIRNLSHGRVAFSNKGKQGILDSNGQIIAPEIYDGLYKYADNRLGYQKGDLWGYIDIDGKEITPPLFPLVWDFKDGMARAIGSTGIGFIDTTGIQLIPPSFIEVRDFYEGLARVQVFR